MSTPTLDVAAVRAQFPALSADSPYIYADNAGGSQCLTDVVTRLSHYLLHTNVQLGADYSVSVTSTQRATVDGPEAARELFGAASAEEIVYGSSSTMLVENLARALEADVQEGEEVIVTGEHECEYSAPVFYAISRLPRSSERGPVEAPLRAARRRPQDLGPHAALRIPHEPIRRRAAAGRAPPPHHRAHAARRVHRVLEHPRLHRARARSRRGDPGEGSRGWRAEGGGVRGLRGVCAAPGDRRAGVGRGLLLLLLLQGAYSPVLSSPLPSPSRTRSPRVQVYAAHVSVLYVRKSSLETSLSSLAHHFLAVATKPYKLQPGGPGYELPYSCTAVPLYLRGLTPAGTLDAAWAAVAAHEQELLGPLLGYLRGKRERGVRIVGDETEGATRVPTVSFVVVGDRAMRSPDVVKAFDAKGDVSSLPLCWARELR